MEDRQIIKLLLDRAEGAIDALARRFGPRLQSLAMNILGDAQDAEECVNDTYLALWNTIPPEQPNPLSAYACRIARNTALKRLRSNTALKRRSDYDLSLDELAGCIPGACLEETVDARALGRAIDRFLGTLKENHRTIFIRRYWFGDSPRQIGQAFAMTEGAVSTQLSRTRQKLKDYLTQEGFL